MLGAAHVHSRHTKKENADATTECNPSSAHEDSFTTAIGRHHHHHRRPLLVIAGKDKLGFEKTVQKSFVRHVNVPDKASVALSELFIIRNPIRATGQREKELRDGTCVRLSRSATVIYTRSGTVEKSGSSRYRRVRSYPVVGSLSCVLRMENCKVTGEADPPVPSDSNCNERNTRPDSVCKTLIAVPNSEVSSSTRNVAKTHRGTGGRKTSVREVTMVMTRTTTANALSTALREPKQSAFRPPSLTRKPPSEGIVVSSAYPVPVQSCFSFRQSWGTRQPNSSQSSVSPGPHACGKSRASSTASGAKRQWRGDRSKQCKPARSPLRERGGKVFRADSAPILPRSGSVGGVRAERTLFVAAKIKDEKVPSMPSTIPVRGRRSALRQWTPPVRRPTPAGKTGTAAERGIRGMSVLHKNIYSSLYNTVRDPTPANKSNENNKPKRNSTPKRSPNGCGRNSTPLSGLFWFNRPHLATALPCHSSPDILRFRPQRLQHDTAKQQEQQSSRQVSVDKEKYMRQYTISQQKSIILSRPVVRPTNSTICREAALRQRQREQVQQELEKHAAGAEHMPRVSKETIRRKNHRSGQAPARRTATAGEKCESKENSLDSVASEPKLLPYPQETSPPILRAHSLSSTFSCKEELPLSPPLKPHLQAQQLEHSVDASALSDCDLSFRRYQCYIRSETRVEYIRPGQFDSPYRGIPKYPISDAVVRRGTDCPMGILRRRASAGDLASQNKNRMGLRFHNKRSDSEEEDMHNYGAIASNDEDGLWTPTSMNVKGLSNNTRHAISPVEYSDDNGYYDVTSSDKKAVFFKNHERVYSSTRSPPIRPSPVKAVLSFDVSNTISPIMNEHVTFNEATVQKQSCGLFRTDTVATPASEECVSVPQPENHVEKTKPESHARGTTLSLAFCRTQSAQRFPRPGTPAETKAKESPLEVRMHSPCGTSTVAHPCEVIAPPHKTVQRTVERGNRANTLFERGRVSRRNRINISKDRVMEK